MRRLSIPKPDMSISTLHPAAALTYPARKPLSRRTDPMIFSLFRRTARPDTISALYGTIVAQARLPHVFIATMPCRTRLTAVSTCSCCIWLWCIERLRRDERPHKPLAQGLFDRFCQDMDDNLREMGIGDLKVPKEMRRMGEAFYGRAQAYRAALARPATRALAQALVRNIYGGTAPSEASRRGLRPMSGRRCVTLDSQRPAGPAGGQAAF